MKKTILLRISGRVQGVWYRKYAREQALKLGISGTVRNLGDGSVEVVAQGDTVALENFTVWCRVGPPKADVIGMELLELASDQLFRGFEILD